MPSAFDLVKQTEETAADRIRQARQQADELQRETERTLENKSRRLDERQAALQAQLAAEEEKTAAEIAALSRGEWEEERKQLQKAADQNRDAVVSFLVKKVIDQDGDR